MANTSQSSRNTTDAAATANQWRFGLFENTNEAVGPLFQSQDHAYLLPQNTVDEDDNMEDLDGASFGGTGGGAYSGSVPASIALVSFNIITLFI